MRRALIWLSRGLPVLAGLVAGLLALANTGPGRGLVATVADKATGGQVRIEALSGRFPDALRVGRIALGDAKGTYLTIDAAALDWSPLRLFVGELRIDALTAERIAVARMPESGGESGGGGAWPVRIDLARLRIEHVTLAPPLTPQAVDLAVSGSMTIRSAKDAHVRVAVASGAARYDATVRMTPDGLRAEAAIHEADGGILADLIGVGGMDARATLNGPLDRIATDLKVEAASIMVTATGSLDALTPAADLTVVARSSAVSSLFGLAWQALRVDARIQGRLTEPTVNGSATVDAIAVAGVRIDRLQADFSGRAGEVGWHGVVTAPRLPGSLGERLAADPITLDGTIRLDQPDRPVRIDLRHRLVQAQGTATLTPLAAKVHVVLADLAPFAAIGAVDIQGRTDLDLVVRQEADGTTVTVRGPLSITGGQRVLVNLVGSSGQVELALTAQGSDLTVQTLRLGGQSVGLAASGHLGKAGMHFDWSAALSDLAALHPTLGGSVDVSGDVTGTFGDFAAMAHLTGDVAASGYRSGHITFEASAESLPARPRFSLTGAGTLLEAPVALRLNGALREDGLTVTVAPSGWRSLSAQADLRLPPGAMVPEGRASLRMERLADLAPLVGIAIGGAASIDLKADAATATLRMDLRHATGPGAAVDDLRLEAAVTDPMADPRIDATLVAQGLRAGGVGAAARLTVRGSPEHLDLGLTADARDVGGAPVSARASAALRPADRSLTLTAFRGLWRARTLTLAGPARIGFADAVTIERLALALGKTTLTVNGRIGDALDLTASLRNLPADLAADLVANLAPAFAADGSFNADLRLTGPPAAPDGTVSLRGTGLRMRQGAGAALPPGSLNLDAKLAGGRAQGDARLQLGGSALTVSGTVPTAPREPMNLRTRGQIDLALTDPILTPTGRRARGRIDVDLGITGSMTAPLTNGTVRLTGGDLRDAALGGRIHDLTATVRADGDRLTLAALKGTAGSGAIEADGSLGLAPPMPIDLRVRASNARPLSSDLMTAVVDATMTLSGQAMRNINLGGSVRVRRADIRIPEALPVSVATIPVRLAGAPVLPPKPAAAMPAIALNLTLDAPSRVFVRGRGVDAELGGQVIFGGTLAALHPSGGLSLRRGSLNLAGQVIGLTEGRIDFTGAGLADPSLRLVASAQRGDVTASATVSGSVRGPKITLSSVPDLPGDEVLARLLFNSAVGRLSPFQIAQLANALASLSGGPSLGDDPLAKLRAATGLDRLSVGSDANDRPVLEAGSYLTEGVYLGARQGASGSGSQATLQVDIGRGLKLEATTGTGQATSPGQLDPSNQSSVGITYQLEY